MYFCPADLAPMCSASAFAFKQANSGLGSVTDAHSGNLRGGGGVVGGRLSELGGGGRVKGSKHLKNHDMHHCLLADHPCNHC